MSISAEGSAPVASDSDTGQAVLPDVSRSLREAQIALVYQQAGPTLLGAGAALLFYGYVLYGFVPGRSLFLWLLVSGLVYAVRYVLIRLYHRTGPEARDRLPWDLWYLLGALASGILWGLSGVLLLPVDSIAHQAFLIVGVTGLGAGATVAYAAVRGLPQAFIVPALAPFGLYLIGTGTDMQQMMGFVVLMFMVVLITSAMIIHRSIERSLRLGLEKEGLADTLSRAKEEADALNAELRAEIDERRHAELRIRASRQELSRILDNMQDMYFRTDLDGRVVQVSPSVAELLGYSAEEVRGVNIADVFVERSDLNRFMLLLERSGGAVRSYEARMRRKDGSEVWVSKNAQYYRDETGAVAGIEGTSHDITRLKRVQAELNAEKERALVTLAAIADGVIATDAAGNIDYINPVAESLTGWSATRALGRPLADVFRVVDEDTRQLAEDPVRQCLRSRRIYRIPGHPILLASGDQVEYSIEARVAPIFDEFAQVTGTALVFHDVTELRGLAREMSYQAAHDMLTGLVNRREFEIRTEQAIETAQREGLHHALCYLDLDQFKVVNDTCGHIAGDELLKQLAGLLQSRIRESDTLARLGGDEFGVLLEACPLDKAKEIAEELRAVIKGYRFEWQGQSFEIGVSIGLVAIVPGVGSLAEVLSAADAACYVAKEQGRNRTHVFDSEDTALMQHQSHMEWVQRLQRALERDSFELYCQRAVSVDKNAAAMQYNEVLLRMREGDKELIAPGVFIPAAERYHLMPVIDRWVVRHALDRLAGKQSWADTECFAINLSGQSLGDDSFFDYVSAELDASGIAPARLCFEITETAAVANLRSAQRFIAGLRKRGCKFALDDFGSGLSSFAYLKRLPVDYLKIDGRFVKDMLDDPVDHAMVESINQLGHVVGVQTIAESVENERLLTRLRQLGIDYAQGYAIHKPEPLEGFLG